MAEFAAFINDNNEEEEGDDNRNNSSVNQPQDPNDDDYYGFLNLSREAEPAEIKNQYKKLSRIYHPDKHTDPDIQLKARQQFDKINTAHEVLMDPIKRAIYDTLGTKGLKEAFNGNNLEVVPRYRTPTEIREDFERNEREREERMMERKTNPKGQVTVNINASEIFTPYEGLEDEDEEYYNDAGPYLELTGFHFHQSIEAPITTRDTLTMAGSVSTENGRGKGNINFGWRKSLSNRAWGEAEIGGSSDGLDFGVKGWSQFGSSYFTNFHANCTSTPTGMRPAMVIVLGSQLDAKSQGTLTWRAGSLGGLQTQYTWEHSVYRFVASFHLGVPHSYVGVNFSQKIDEQKTRCRASIRAGTFGVFAEYGVDRKISQMTTLSATIALGIPLGVSLRIKVARANQVYLFPIHLCDQVLPAPVVYGTITPMILYVIVNKLFVEPYEKEKLARERATMKQQYKARLAEKKAEAESAILFMQPAFTRSVADEEAKGGLIITSAKFGRLNVDPDSVPASTSTNDEIIDVTVPLQILVKDSKLVLHEKSKCQLPGFYDPAPGDEKLLRVQYTFQKKPHEVTIKDDEPIRIPKESHRKNQI